MFLTPVVCQNVKYSNADNHSKYLNFYHGTFWIILKVLFDKHIVVNVILLWVLFLTKVGTRSTNIFNFKFI